MFLCKRNIWFMLGNLILFYIEPLSSKPQYNKYWQNCLNAVSSAPMNMRWLNFPVQSNINVETTLSHQHWIDVILSTLFQRCFFNVETTSRNVRRFNFHFHPNINVETMLMNVDDQDCRRLEISHRLICFTILSPKVMTNFCNLESLFFLITYFFSDFGFLWSVLFGRSFFYFVRLFYSKINVGCFYYRCI